MVTKKQAKRQRDIKQKLMAAICMLLVSSIMMVSSTYAWFTLSTAPEVTGITTAVGANGNLEMALMPVDGQVSNISSGVNDSTLTDIERNVTWGNLVDLSNSSYYGLDEITLYPAALNADLWDDAKLNPKQLAAAILSTPAYGADGRVSELKSDTLTGVYGYNTTKSFIPNDAAFGVRAIGTASGMTDRQLDYRNSRAAANTAMSQAKTAASLSLTANGSGLANIAIKKALETDAKYTAADVNALTGMVNDLLGTDEATGALQYIETAYLNYIRAYAASAKTGDADTVWSAVTGLIDAEGATLTTVVNGLTTAGLDLDTVKLDENGSLTLKTVITSLNATIANVKEQKTKLADLAPGEDGTYTWNQLSDILTDLADPTQMLVNNFKAGELMNSIDAFVNSVLTGGGIVVSIASGGGVYADVADHCGDYTAAITIEKVQYGSLNVENVAARMNTKSNQATPYLKLTGNQVEAAGAPKSSGGQNMPISDFFGYVVDLVFRTNAADSNLLLQVDAVDRIYEQNTTTGGQIEGTTETTMGHGSTMTFNATTPDFTNDQVKALMGAIRIVFFDPDNKTVYGTAKLDADQAELTAEGLTAEMYLYKMTAGGEVTYTETTYDATAEGVEYYFQNPQYTYAVTDDPANAGVQLYKKDGDMYVETTHPEDGVTTYYTRTEGEPTYVKSSAPSSDEAAGKQLYLKSVAEAGEQRVENNVITALTQNQAQKVSVLVYLDGNHVGNSDVAATAATSMTGKMNLQFASSANLKPMDYTPLMEQTGGTGSTDADSVKVTLPEGVTGEATAKKNTDYSFTLAESYTLNEITVGGTKITNPTLSDGKYTIPAANVTGDIVITVTAPAGN